MNRYYDRDFTGFHLETLRLVTNKYVKNKKVLDIGCGGGWCEKIYLKRGVRKMVGIDTSKTALKLARNIKNRAITFKFGSAISIPFKKNTFDTIVSWEVLEHIPRGTERKMFAEAFRVLKPGGYFFLSTQHNNPLSTVLDPAWWLMGHRHYSERQLRTFATGAGFSIKRLYLKGKIYIVLYALDLYISKWIFRREIFFEKFILEKTEKEYLEETGFHSIILKCQKPDVNQTGTVSE